jgi:uncharacterized protein (TIGR03435 family)
MDMLTRQLGQILGRPVIDKTGLKGNYDVELQFSPEPGQSGGLFGIAPPPGPVAAHDDSSAPSLFTALEEKLGLRLESTKAPIKMLVIDGVAKPSEN